MIIIFGVVIFNYYDMSLSDTGIWGVGYQMWRLNLQHVVHKSKKITDFAAG